MTLTLSILATTDIHGYITSTRYSDNKEVEFGLAKLASLIKKERSKNPTILIDNGDTIQGNALTYYDAKISNTSSKSPIADVFNYINYDACIIGNHEFNYGLEYLYRYMTNLKCPTLSCNIIKKTDGYFASYPYILKNIKDGPKIAIIGATTHYIPNWEKTSTIESLTFLDAFQSVKQTVDLIKKDENVDCIIVAYHGGIEKDLTTGEPLEQQTGENQGYKMLQEIEGIDILITGHQHRTLYEDNILGKAVTQSGCNGTTLAKIDIKFNLVNEKWVIKNKKTQLLKCDNISPDKEVLDLIRPLEKKTQIWLDKTIGQIGNDDDLLIKDHFKARLEKHKIVTFLNKIQLNVSNADISLVSLGNNIKGISKNITMRDIISTYVYPNTLNVLELSGKIIKEAIEKSSEYFRLVDGVVKVSDSYLYPKPQHYNYDMYDGITYTIDLKEPIGNRVKNIIYKGEPLNMNYKYQVVMNNYRASGGGNYNMFKNQKILKEINIDMVEIIVNYIRENKYIIVPDIKNINIVY